MKLRNEEVSIECCHDERRILWCYADCRYADCRYAVSWRHAYTRMNTDLVLEPNLIQL
jgi:hypothetical protein